MHECVCVCESMCVRARAALVYMCECVQVYERLCRFVSESGDVTTGLLSGLSLPSWTGHLTGLNLEGIALLSVCRTLGSPISDRFTQIPTSLSPPGLYFCRKVFRVPKYSHNALQDSREGALGCLEGQGSHWLDCCFLIGL